MDHKEFAARPHGVGSGATVGSKRRRPDGAEAHGAGAGAGGSKPKRKHDSDHDGPKERPRHLSVDRYLRGGQDGSIAKQTTDLKLKAKIKRKEKEFADAAKEAARSELLLTEDAGYLEAEGMERTYRFKQSDIAAAADIGVAKKAVSLNLDTYGPYRVSYTRSGRHMLLGGEKGHIAVVDWNTFKLSTEFHVRETVRDVCFLHNASMFAVAQKKYAYIYDARGTEIHKLKSHLQPLALDFLPYHFLLTSIGNAGFLKYQDVSTGALVAEHNTHAGGSDVLRQNPWNAVMCLGQTNGVVSMWTPNMSTPVVKMLTHTGRVTALAVDPAGRYMVTAGGDARMKVWDIRKFQEQPLFNYFLPTPAHALDVSHRGFVAVGFGSHVQVWGRDFATELSPEPFTAPLALRAGAGAGAARGKPGAGGSRASSAGAAAVPRTLAGSGTHVRFDADADEEEADGAPDGVGSAAAAAGGADAAEGDDDDAEAVAAAGAGAAAEPAAPLFVARKRPDPVLPRGVRKAKSPYLKHELPGNAVASVRFRPFDDILAIGHGKGLSSLITPGAGEPNYDSLEADPFQTKKGRQEAEVHQLLDKLAPGMIALDPTAVGGVDTASPALREKERLAAAAVAEGALSSRKKARLARKKRSNIITAARMTIKDKALAKHVEAKEAHAAAEAAAVEGEGSYASAPGSTSALTRFFAKKKAR